MRISKGQIIKVYDIGTLGTVVDMSVYGKTVVADFDFPDGKIRISVPRGIIDQSVSEEAA